MGFMVPGSTLRYGSSFWIVILRPRVSSRLPIDAEARPFPSDDTTPPVTKMNLVCLPDGFAGALMVGSPLSRNPHRVPNLPRRARTGKAGPPPRDQDLPG